MTNLDKSLRNLLFSWGWRLRSFVFCFAGKFDAGFRGRNINGTEVKLRVRIVRLVLKYRTALDVYLFI